MATEKKGMDASQKADLIGKVTHKLAELTEGGISQNNIAARWGISAATLVNLKDKKSWSLIGDAMVRKLASSAHVLQKKVLETNNFVTGKALFEDAKHHQRFLAWVGLTGGGKTTTLQKLCEKESNAYYVKVVTGMKAVDLLEAICLLMKISVGKRNKATMTQEIAVKLNKSGEGLLIIDDAGKLDGAANWLSILELYDATKDKAGIIISGTIQLKKLLEKHAKHDKVGGKELFRRIAFWQGLQNPTLDEVEIFCDQYGIEDEKVMQYIHKSVDNFGALHNLLENAQRKAKGEIITLDILRRLDVGDKSIA
jgi:DNA transposition AAA+ family ATPase